MKNPNVNANENRSPIVIQLYAREMCHRYDLRDFIEFTIWERKMDSNIEGCLQENMQSIKTHKTVFQHKKYRIFYNDC